MKNIITFLFLSLLIPYVTISQTLEEKERQMFEKHLVKARVNWDFAYSNGVVAKTGNKTSRSTYNDNGKVLITETFNKKGQVVTTEKSEYDEFGNRTLYERQSTSGEYVKTSEYNEESNVIEESGYDGTASFRTVYKYNSHNLVTEIIYYSQEQVDEKRIYTYTGKTATVEVLRSGEFVMSRMELTYNDNWDITEERALTPDGKVVESRKLSYNSQGLVTTEEKYKNGVLSYRILYTYDNNGELLKVTEESKSKGTYDKKLFKYDTEGRIVEYKWKRKPKTEYNIKTFVYNDKGICTEEHTLYPATNYQILTKYEYEF